MPLLLPQQNHGEADVNDHGLRNPRSQREHLLRRTEFLPHDWLPRKVRGLDALGMLDDPTPSGVEQLPCSVRRVVLPALGDALAVWEQFVDGHTGLLWVPMTGIRGPVTWAEV